LQGFTAVRNGFRHDARELSRLEELRAAEEEAQKDADMKERRQQELEDRKKTIKDLRDRIKNWMQEWEASAKLAPVQQ